MLDIVGVIINNVEDDSDTGLVESLHHLLELSDTTRGVIGIGGIATLGHIVVHWVIAPVVLGGIEFGLVDRSVIIAGQDMDCVHTQRLQMIDGPWLRQGKELTRILSILAGDGEVTVVHLIDHQIGRRLDRLVGITTPILRIGLHQVDDGATLTVYTHSFGKHTGTFTLPHIEGIVLAQKVALDLSLPHLAI